jgi:tetratricopeptide (TPR) repeat protein
VELGLKETAFEAIRWVAECHRILGQYSAAQTVLDQATASPDWATAAKHTRAGFILTRAFIKQCNDVQLTGLGFANMFDESRRLAEASGNVPRTDFAIAHGNLSSGLIAGDWTSARSSLEASIATILKTDSGHPSLCYFFDYLAAVTYVEGKMDEARQSLNNAQRYYVLAGMFGTAQRALLCQAMIMLAEGNFEAAHEHVRKVMKDATSLGQAASELQWLSGYILGSIELISGQLSKARQFFETTKRFAESQDEFHFRAFCARTLGEVAFLEKDLLRARVHFEDTRSICASAGIVPELLYRHGRHMFYNKPLPDTCRGWTLFLENQFPVVWYPSLRV